MRGAGGSWGCEKGLGELMRVPESSGGLWRLLGGRERGLGGAGGS